MNDEQPSSTEQPVEAPFAAAPPPEAQQPEAPSQDARRRLRELLAVPERDRSDAVWDEIIGLEIDLAPGNRLQSPQGDNARRQEPGRRADQGRQGHRQGQQDPSANKKSGKRFFQKRKRRPGAPGER